MGASLTADPDCHARVRREFENVMNLEEESRERESWESVHVCGCPVVGK